MNAARNTPHPGTGRLDRSYSVGQPGFATLVYVWLILASCVSPAIAQGRVDVRQGQIGQELRVLPYDDARGVRSLTTEAFCSQQQVGVGSARLAWEDGLPPRSYRLDWTIYKNGFDAAAYASFASLDPGQEFTMAFAESPELARIPAFRLTLAERAQVMPDSAISSFVVNGLTSGQNYYWRLLTRTEDGWTPSRIVVVKGPMCPVDPIGRTPAR